MSSPQISECAMNMGIPPPIPIEYNTKGTWRQVGDLYSYTTGPPDASRAVIFIYDVFGPSPQCLQGADRLAEHLNVLVLVPDYFKGCALDHDDFMGETDGSRSALEEHMKGHGDVNKNVATTLQYVADAKLKYPLIRSWGAFGLCWGGKVAVLSSLASSNPFRVTGQASPAGMDSSDADALRVPHICLASRDQSPSAVGRYRQVLQAQQLGQVETFTSMSHGWMGARGDLQLQDVRNEYERGYALVARFFSQHL